MFEVVELSSSTRPAEEASSGEPISSFLKWLQVKGTFECALILPREGIWRKAILPSIAVTPGAVERHREGIETAVRLDGAVIGVRTPRDAVLTFFSGFGYQIVGETTFGSGDKCDPKTAFCREILTEAVEVASRLCQHTLCVFWHDADPIYLLTRSELRANKEFTAARGSFGTAPPHATCRYFTIT